MITCYRLEHKNGDGLFFTKEGVNKLYPEIKYNNNERYAFLNPIRFKEPSYIDFYNNKDYVLYKIQIKQSISENVLGQIIYNIKDIISKQIIDKS